MVHTPLYVKYDIIILAEMQIIYLPTFKAFRRKNDLSEFIKWSRLYVRFSQFQTMFVLDYTISRNNETNELLSQSAVSGGFRYVDIYWVFVTWQ